MRARNRKRLLEEGDVVELNGDHKVYAWVPQHFLYANKRGDFELAHGEVFLSDENFDYLRGKYVVVKTVVDGGGTGMGPHDVFPDGHHVFCESLDGKVKVDFYQTGCFTAMIEDITPIGKAERKWTYKPTP